MTSTDYYKKTRGDNMGTYDRFDGTPRHDTSWDVDLPAMCEDCPVEDCDYPCEELKKKIEEENREWDKFYEEMHKDMISEELSQDKE